MNKMRINRIILIGLISYLCVGVSAYYQPPISGGAKRPVTFQEVQDYFYSRGVYEDKTPAAVTAEPREMSTSEHPGKMEKDNDKWDDLKSHIRSQNERLLAYFQEKEKEEEKEWTKMNENISQITSDLRRDFGERLKAQQEEFRKPLEILREENFELRRNSHKMELDHRREYDKLKIENEKLRKTVKDVESNMDILVDVVRKFLLKGKRNSDHLQELYKKTQSTLHQLESTQQDFHLKIAKLLDLDGDDSDDEDSDSDDEDSDSDDEDSDSDDEDSDSDDEDSDSDDEDSDDEDSDSDDEDSDDEDSDSDDEDEDSDDDDDDIGMRLRRFLKGQYA